MKTIPFLILLSLLQLPADGFALNLTEDDNGRTVSVRKGETLTIELPGNPTTGYIWELVDGDRAVLMPDAGPVFVARSPRFGSGGLFVIRLHALKQGSSGVKILYRRPWEADVPPIRRFELQVIVLPGRPVLQATYRSHEGATATAVFDGETDSVTVSLPDGRRVRLPSALSGSGARYSDGRETFWEHQGTGRFFSGDTLVFEGVALELPPSGR